MGKRSLDKLRSQIAILEGKIENLDLQVDSVSSSNIGWHIEHSFLVLNSVIGAMAGSDQNKFKRKFNFKKVYIFAIGRFPRGKVRAPKSVRPTENIDEPRLSNHLKSTLESISILDNLKEGVFFRHPIFGDLGLRDSVYFLEMHTEHHLKIIEEIERG